MAQPRFRLYLDVDGVINAMTERRAQDFSAVDVTVFGNGMRMTYPILYNQNILNGLQQLRNEFNMELVWLTTWLEDDAILTLVAKLGTIYDGRLLPIPQRRLSGRSAAWKVNALLADLNNDPVPYIWVDDVDIHFYGEKAKSESAERALHISPQPNRGLEMSDLDAMRAFMSDAGPTTDRVRGAVA